MLLWYQNSEVQFSECFFLLNISTDFNRICTVSCEFFLVFISVASAFLKNIRLVVEYLNWYFAQNLIIILSIIFCLFLERDCQTYFTSKHFYPRIASPVFFRVKCPNINVKFKLNLTWFRAMTMQNIRFFSLAVRFCDWLICGHSRQFLIQKFQCYDWSCICNRV